jgi:transcriptional regulator with XRE-family HTH domain
MKKIEGNAKNKITQDIALRISKFIEENNLIDKEFATLTGIPKSTLNGYRNGNSEPKLDAIVKLAKGMNVSTDYLLGIKKSKSPNYGIDYIIEKTGLSEEAVENLIRLKGTYKDSLIKLISFLIEEDLYYPEEEYSQQRLIEIEELDTSEEEKERLSEQSKKQLEEIDKIIFKKKPQYILSKLEEYLTITFNSEEKLYATKEGAFLEKDLEEGIKKYSIKAFGKEIKLGNKLVESVLLDEVKDVLKSSKEKYLKNESDGDKQ